MSHVAVDRMITRRRVARMRADGARDARVARRRVVPGPMPQARTEVARLRWLARIWAWMRAGEEAVRCLEALRNSRPPTYAGGENRVRNVAGTSAA